ncbi:MAG: hypothetical protein QUT30_09690 [Acidobacteriota bacterium]|nr:hypothetical protein [Acidobacteriota bacterium]
MKKIMVFGVLILCVMATQAFAEDIRITRYSGYFSGSGGEFNITALSTDFSGYVNNYAAVAKNNGGFETFCLETNEYVDIPKNYFASIDAYAIQGGSGGPKPDPISVGTAWLYQQFALGTLTGYNYTPGVDRASSALLLQQTIWYLEQESVVAPASNPFYDAVLAKFTTLALARADYKGSSVAVLNLYADSAHTIHKQSQLIYLPDGGASVLLLGLGIGSLALLSRKFNL